MHFSRGRHQFGGTVVNHRGSIRPVPRFKYVGEWLADGNGPISTGDQLRLYLPVPPASRFRSVLHVSDQVATVIDDLGTKLVFNGDRSGESVCVVCMDYMRMRRYSKLRQSRTAWQECVIVSAMPPLDESRIRKVYRDPKRPPNILATKSLTARSRGQDYLIGSSPKILRDLAPDSHEYDFGASRHKSLRLFSNPCIHAVVRCPQHADPDTLQRASRCIGVGIRQPIASHLFDPDPLVQLQKHQ